MYIAEVESAASQLREILDRYRKLADEYSQLHTRVSEQAQSKLKSQFPTLSPVGSSAVSSEMELKVRQLLQTRMASLMKIPERITLTDLSSYNQLLLDWDKLRSELEQRDDKGLSSSSEAAGSCELVSATKPPVSTAAPQSIGDKIAMQSFDSSNPIAAETKKPIEPPAVVQKKPPSLPSISGPKPQLPASKPKVPIAPAKASPPKSTPELGSSAAPKFLNVTGGAAKTNSLSPKPSVPVAEKVDSAVPKLVAVKPLKPSAESNEDNIEIFAGASLQFTGAKVVPDKKNSVEALVSRFEAVTTEESKPSTADPADATVVSNPFAEEVRTPASTLDPFDHDPFADPFIDPIDQQQVAFDSLTAARREFSRDLLSRSQTITVSLPPPNPVEDIFADENQVPAVDHRSSTMTESAPFLVYEALYDFEAQDSAHLTFKRGQLIAVPTKKFYEQQTSRGSQHSAAPSLLDPQRYAFGYLQQQQQQSLGTQRKQISGSFPLNHVRLICDLSKALPNLFEALYDYSPRQPDELELTTGSFVVHLEHFDNEWSRCISLDDGSIGLCPKSYLKALISVEGDSPVGSKRSSVVSSTFEDVDPFADVFAIKAFDDALEKRLTGLVQLRSKPAEALLDTVHAVSASSSSSSLPGLVTTSTAAVAAASVEDKQKLEKLLGPAETGVGSKVAPQVLQRQTWVQHMNPDFVASLSDEERKRQEAIFELTYTEWTYVRNLQTVLQVFLDPIKHNSLLGDRDVYTIFCNIEHLLICNVKILSDFEQIQKKNEYFIDRIGNILVPYFEVVRSENARRLLRSIEINDRNQPGTPQDNIDDTLLGYYRYCANQFVASKLFQDRLKQSPKFAEFVKNCTLDPRCRSLTLSSFLLEPMQRVTRYPLLINQILHYTDKNHPDHADLVRALNMAELLLKNINQAARKVENFLKISMLADSIDLGPLSGTGSGAGLDLAGMTKRMGRRELLFQSELKKAKSGRKLAVFLFNDLIILCEPTGWSSSKIKYTLYRQPLPLSETKIADVGPENRIWSHPELCFQFVHKEDIITVRAADARMKENWINQISNAHSQRKEWENRDASVQSSTQLAELSATSETCIGTLNVLLIDCSAIRFQDLSRKMSVFVDIQINGQQKQKSRLFTLIPWDRDRSIARWNQSWMFTVHSLDSNMCVRLMKYDKYSRDEELGRAELSLDFLEYYGDKTTEVIYLKIKGQISANISVQLNYRIL